MTGQADLGGGSGEVEDYPDFEDYVDTARAWPVATGGPSLRAGQVPLWTRPQHRAPFESGYDNPAMVPSPTHELTEDICIDNIVF